jgi:hypothetical protein
MPRVKNEVARPERIVIERGESQLCVIDVRPAHSYAAPSSEPAPLADPGPISWRLLLDRRKMAEGWRFPLRRNAPRYSLASLDEPKHFIAIPN